MLTWYRAQPPERQGAVMIGVALCVVVVVLASSFLDLPFWVPGVDGKPFLIIPYTLETNDMRFATPQGFNTGDQFFTYLKDAFDVLYQEGAEGSPKMLNIGLHCRLVGRPGRAAALARFVDYVLGHEKVWIPRRIDIARHWIENHHPSKVKGI